MSDLSAWRTHDVETQTPLLLHAFIERLTLALPHHGARATLIFTLKPL